MVQHVQYNHAICTLLHVVMYEVSFPNQLFYKMPTYTSETCTDELHSQQKH